jgi:hypothetical protein
LAGGLIVQPFLAAGLALAIFPVFLLDPEGRTLAGGYPSDPTDAALSVAFGAGVVAAVVTVLGVWPTAVWLLKRRPLTFVGALRFGLGFGILPYVLLGVAAGGKTYGPSGVLRGLLFSSVLGLIGAAVFWLIALRSHRVPRDARAG